MMNVRVRCQDDARLHISLIRYMEKEGVMSDSMKDMVIETKRAVRKYLNKAPSGVRRVADYCDSCITLEKLDGVTSFEEAESHFYNHQYMEYIPSPYDCTGQLFTNWHKIFERNGEYWLYHSFGRDV